MTATDLIRASAAAIQGSQASTVCAARVVGSRPVTVEGISFTVDRHDFALTYVSFEYRDGRIFEVLQQGSAIPRLPAEPGRPLHHRHVLPDLVQLARPAYPDTAKGR